MPARKNTPAKTKSTPTPREKAADKRRKDAGKKRPKPAARDGRKTKARSGRNKREQEIHDDLVLIFLTEYQAFEQGLVRAGYTRPGRLPGSTQVDWERFARHIERYFRPEPSSELQGAVTYLLYEQGSRQQRLARLQNPLPWEIVTPRSDLVWLSELVQQTRNQLLLGFHVPETPAPQSARIMAALLVVEGMAYTDPQVECQLNAVL